MKSDFKFTTTKELFKFVGTIAAMEDLDDHSTKALEGMVLSIEMEFKNKDRRIAELEKELMTLKGDMIQEGRCVCGGEITSVGICGIRTCNICEKEY